MLKLVIFVNPHTINGSEFTKFFYSCYNHFCAAGFPIAPPPSGSLTALGCGGFVYFYSFATAWFVYFYSFATAWKGWTVISAVMGVAGLYWLWAE